MKRIGADNPPISRAHALLMGVLAVLFAAPMCLCSHCFTTTLGLDMLADAHSTESAQHCCQQSDSDAPAPANAPEPAEHDGCQCEWDTPTRPDQQQPAVLAQSTPAPFAFPPALLAFESADALAASHQPDRLSDDHVGPPPPPSLVSTHVLLLI